VSYRGTKWATRPEQNNLEGHGLRDFRTEFAQKQRSTNGHCEEEYKPSSWDPQRPLRATKWHAWKTL